LAMYIIGDIDTRSSKRYSRCSLSVWNNYCNTTWKTCLDGVTVRHVLVIINRSQLWLPVGALSGSDPGQIVHMYESL